MAHPNQCLTSLSQRHLSSPGLPGPVMGAVVSLLSHCSTDHTNSFNADPNSPNSVHPKRDAAIHRIISEAGKMGCGYCPVGDGSLSLGDGREGRGVKEVMVTVTETETRTRGLFGSYAMPTAVGEAKMAGGDTQQPLKPGDSVPDPPISNPDTAATSVTWATLFTYLLYLAYKLPRLAFEHHSKVLSYYHLTPSTFFAQHSTPIGFLSSVLKIYTSYSLFLGLLGRLRSTVWLLATFIFRLLFKVVFAVLQGVKDLFIDLHLVWWHGGVVKRGKGKGGGKEKGNEIKEVKAVVVKQTRRGRVWRVVTLPFVRPRSVVLGVVGVVGCWYWVKAKLGWGEGVTA